MPSKALVAKAPCAKCPFRSDIPIYLRRERRVEIATSLLRGQQFSCHATVDYSHENDEGDTIPDSTGSAFCAGAAKALMKIGAPNQQLRIMERLGMIDLDEIEAGAIDVWDLHDWQNVPEGATADDAGFEELEPEGECCNTVDANCLAPAGYGIGGGVAMGTEYADGQCYECGEACCTECLTDCPDGHARCGPCYGWQMEDEDDDG